MRGAFPMQLLRWDIGATRPVTREGFAPLEKFPPPWKNVLDIV